MLSPVYELHVVDPYGLSTSRAMGSVHQTLKRYQWGLFVTGRNPNIPKRRNGTYVVRYYPRYDTNVRKVLHAYGIKIVEATKLNQFPLREL